MGPNVTIIGGGSSSFVPVLIRRLMQSEPGSSSWTSTRAGSE
jgi:hypothetical protein